MIKFNPEKIECLKNRFKESLLAVYNPIECKENPDKRPGIKQENIFDFEDGIRLIISRDVVKATEVIHFSASINPKIYNGSFGRSLHEKMVMHFIDLYEFTDNINVHYAGITNAGIPHWYVEYKIIN